ncbi:WXG100 family type VII secretion target [Streptomyces sp. NBC_00057]|uniref:WXG100 family type VII secretion target n=1 Tax=Streptomyces sp. NBC_00057 TaxID=2975634 RepID=UPI0032524A71
MTNPAGGYGLADDRIVQAKNQITKTAGEVSRESRELADILATVGAGWTGVGASGFTSAQIMINEDHDQIRRLLNVLLNAVGSTKELSNANDEEVRAAFNAVKDQAPSGNTSGLNNV